jgi:hypothetical protein
MHPITSRYRSESGFTLIEIKLDRLEQLFNSFDPSPFHVKDLDDDAEEYIVGAVREFPLHDKLKLVFYLADEPSRTNTPADLTQAIHAYFEYRYFATKRDLRFELQIGRTSLIIGLAFLTLCVSLQQIFFARGEGVVERIFSEGLVILGWVAMWRPLQTFLYDWWPIRHKGRIYAKLAAMPVEIRPVEQLETIRSATRTEVG